MARSNKSQNIRRLPMGRGLRLDLAREQKLSIFPEFFQDENFDCGRSGTYDGWNLPERRELVAVLRYANFLFCVYPRDFILLMHVRLHGLVNYRQMADPVPGS